MNKIVLGNNTVRDLTRKTRQVNHGVKWEKHLNFKVCMCVTEVLESD